MLLFESFNENEKTKERHVLVRTFNFWKTVEIVNSRLSPLQEEINSLSNRPPACRGRTKSRQDSIGRTVEAKVGRNPGRNHDWFWGYNGPRKMITGRLSNMMSKKTNVNCEKNKENCRKQKQPKQVNTEPANVNRQNTNEQHCHSQTILKTQ